MSKCVTMYLFNSITVLLINVLFLKTPLLHLAFYLIIVNAICYIMSQKNFSEIKLLLWPSTTIVLMSTIDSTLISMTSDYWTFAVFGALLISNLILMKK